MKRVLFILGLFLLVATSLAATRENGGFIIENADDSTILSMTASSELNALIANVAPHMIIEYANALRNYALSPVPGALNTLLGQVEARFVVEYANANRYYDMTYPMALIGDTAAPQVSNLVVAPSSGNSVRITWTTDEYTTSLVEYGLEPGTYTQTIPDDWFRKTHQITLAGLTAGETYYYRLHNTDRSGNSVQSGEGTFTAVILVYLPVVIR